MDSTGTKGDTALATPAVFGRAFWSLPASERAASFAELRRVAPVSRQPASDVGPGPGRPFWAVTRHAEVQHVSRHPELYHSSRGVALTETPDALLDLNGSFLVLDDARHSDLRRLTSAAFTPKRVARLAADIATQADAVVDEFVEAGCGDVVEDLATKLPLWTFCTMMGVPEEMRAALHQAVEAQSTAPDPESGGGAVDGGASAVDGVMAMHRIARQLVGARRARPGDDIFSVLAGSTLDGKPLSARQLGALFVMFATAGYDTTRNATSHGIKLFADNPEQWARLREDPALVPQAVEEVFRCASPVIHFRRTATSTTRLADVEIEEGDWVVLFYESANYDETVFAHPECFDIGRNPNPHVAFGGGGPHFCLGANLARVQLRALFARLVARIASIEVGQPEYLHSPFLHGIERMSLSVTPR
jgi:cytochrome P450